MIEELRTGNRSKVARIHGLQPLAKNGRILLRPWMKQLRQEFLAFPRGAHDDLLDALAYQLDFWKHTEFLKQKDRAKEFDKFVVDRVFTGVYRKSARGEGFPADVMGLTSIGTDLVTATQDWPDSAFANSYVLGGPINSCDFAFLGNSMYH